MMRYWTALLFCAAVSCYPADPGTVEKPEPSSGDFAETELPMLGVLSEDKKNTLTYVLGQPKTGSLQSPAELLSPDRYEFYTFDDDGQIVKKLMSVKEIQKILANNDRGDDLEEPITPVEYYQILTVSPDVESLPTVSRINPNEPLFSIHDVIASVQNVLRSEIRTKQTQPPPAVLLGPATPTPEAESFTDAPVQVTKVTSSTSQHTQVQTPAVHKINATIVKPTTKKPAVTTSTTTEVPRTETKKVSVASTTPASLKPSAATATSSHRPSGTTATSTRAPSTTQSQTKPPSTTASQSKPTLTTVTQSRPSSTTVTQSRVPSTTASQSTSTSTTVSHSRPSSTTVSQTRPPSSTVAQTRPPSTTASQTKPSSTTVSQAKPSATTVALPRPSPTTVSQSKPVPVTPRPLKVSAATLGQTRPVGTTAAQPRPSPTTDSPTVKPLTTTGRPRPVPSKPTQPVQTTVSHAPVTTTQSPTPTTQRRTTATQTEATKTTQAATTAARLPETSTGAPAMSLLDAHPGLVNNFTLAELETLSEEILSDALVEEFTTTEAVTTEAATEPSFQNLTETQNAIAQVQIPINQDLAESVSSVLSQIASEISMNNNMDFETGLIRSTQETVKGLDVAEISTDEPETTTEEVVMTTTPGGLPLSWLKRTTQEPIQSKEDLDEVTTDSPPTTTFRPQNKPRPFQKIPIDENLIASASNNQVQSAGRLNVSETATYKTVEKINLTETELATSTIVNSNELKEEVTTPLTELDEASATTVVHEATTVVSTVSYEQSTFNVEDSEATTRPPTSSDSNQTISVQVIQEGDTGRIPRPTQQPDVAAATELSPEMKEAIAETASSVALPTEESIESATEAYVSESTTVYAEEVEAKESTASLSEETTAEPGVDVSFVPMVIRTSTASDAEPPAEQAESTPNSTLDRDTTEREETPTTTPSYTTEVPTTEALESKINPEGGLDLKNESPVEAATPAAQKQTAAPAPQRDVIPPPAVKQSVPTYGKPHYGKPQKPVFIKPSKRPQSEAKPLKPVTRPKEPAKEEIKRPFENHLQSAPSSLELEAAPDENLGLEATTANLDGDVRKFADLCNELAFSLWSSITHNGLSFARSVVISPFAVTSLLAMVFLGARGPTSGQMNDVLKLDDMVTFNPHLVFRNVTESLVISRNSGVATAAFVRELYSDKAKGKLLDFYKERAQQFYDGHVEEVNFKTVGETLRRVTNHLVKRQTWGKITDFLRGSTIVPRAPLAAFGANVFQTDCSRASTKDRDGEMYFVVLPSSRLRRLVPVPSVVYRDGFLAGYEPGLDATVVSLGVDSAVSTLLVLPGQQGLVAPGDSLARLEHHLLGASYRRGHWTRLMRSLLPRPGLELQIPRLSHKSVINVTASLQKMGLRDLFSAEKADLTGLNGIANDLHLSDMIQANLFSTCGEEPIGTRHHSEIYPASPLVRRQKSADNVFSESIESLFAVSDFEDPSVAAMPLELRPRQARIPEPRIPEPPRLRLDRPFLFFVRHNPTGLLLHMGRFNPRLQP